MPVDPTPRAPLAAPLPHLRKLAFASGALLTILAIMAIRVVVGHP